MAQKTRKQQTCKNGRNGKYIAEATSEGRQSQTGRHEH